LKRLAFVIAAFCALAGACTDKDTNRPAVWARSTESRLTDASVWQPCRASLSDGHVVPEAQCGPPPRFHLECDEILTRVDAARALVSEPRCLDAAITRLERLAAGDPASLSDLAAAYYLKAQRDDMPSGFLRAYDAAERAVAVSPRLPAARFNLALAQEALGLFTEAIASWSLFLRLDHSSWAAEARARRDRLVRDARVNPEHQWEINRAAIPDAIRKGDRATLGQLIAPFPATAEKYLVEDLLAQWATSPTRERLRSARLFADELSRVTANQFASDVVAAIERATPKQFRWLRKGQVALSAARSADVAIAVERGGQRFTESAALLERGRSPLALDAKLGGAIDLVRSKNETERALQMIAPVEEQAHRHGYGLLAAEAQSTRGYTLVEGSRYLEALGAYDAARDAYIRVGDQEDLLSVQVRRIGLLRVLGQNELAFREAFQAMHNRSHISLRSRHLLLGDTELTAINLGFPQGALGYQNIAVRLLQERLAAVPPEQTDTITGLEYQLSTALRARAGIEVRLDDYEHARQDLDEAARLSKRPDPSARRALDARIEEVRGQALLRTNPGEAAAAFTKALPLAQGAEYRTFIAALYAQRAEAERRAGDSAAAERDFRAAVGELHKEEASLLEHREGSDSGDLWKAYFSRFQETYRLLIRLLMEENRVADAFAYAERARGEEPLSLVLRLPSTAESFRQLAQRETIDIPRVQALLPRATYVIEYCVTDDRTYAWIVSRDHFSALTLPVRTSDVDRWTAALQRAARIHDDNAFEAGLYAPYDALISAPLGVIHRIAEKGARLVFVPDGAMHGLPFAALRDPATRRPLIEWAPVAISGSTLLYVSSLLRDGAIDRRAPSVLLVGDPAFNDRLAVASGLHRLPAARDEVRAIHNLYGSHAAVLIDREATAPRFLQLAPASSIIHIAGHAITNGAAPAHSVLLFAPSSHDSGALDAETLLKQGLRLDRTRLVVLSVCSSAGGLPVGPEGVAPLVRPFIGAGASAVIGTLWDVDDATAKEVLVSFHQHYRQGSDAATALRAAQLDLLGNKNPGLRSGLAWAPFEVIGFASSPFGAPPNREKEKPP
jgi:CHAT domain-containing protein